MIELNINGFILHVNALNYMHELICRDGRDAPSDDIASRGGGGVGMGCSRWLYLPTHTMQKDVNTPTFCLCKHLDLPLPSISTIETDRFYTISFFSFGFTIIVAVGAVFVSKSVHEVILN